MIQNQSKSLVVSTRYKVVIKLVQSEYEAPDHKNIDLYKIPKRKYVPSNAPLPSSNYKRQFYDYKSQERP